MAKKITNFQGLERIVTNRWLIINVFDDLNHGQLNQRLHLDNKREVMRYGSRQIKKKNTGKERE